MGAAAVARRARRERLLLGSLPEFRFLLCVSQQLQQSDHLFVYLRCLPDHEAMPDGKILDRTRCAGSLLFQVVG